MTTKISKTKGEKRRRKRRAKSVAPALPVIHAPLLLRRLYYPAGAWWFLEQPFYGFPSLCTRGLCWPHLALQRASCAGCLGSQTPWIAAPEVATVLAVGCLPCALQRESNHCAELCSSGQRSSQCITPQVLISLGREQLYYCTRVAPEVHPPANLWLRVVRLQNFLSWWPVC